MRTLDLFAGIGGWTLGLHAAGFETVAAAEKDDWKRAQYQRLYPEVKVYGDVRQLTGDQVRSDCGPVGAVVGSPPCKHISSARAGGQQGVDGDGLFFEAVRLVDELRPTWCAFENSPHLRTRGADRVLAEIERAGYTCWPIVVGACHAGAAHRRQRVWLLGRIAAGEQGRPAGQSRKSRGVVADVHCLKGRRRSEQEKPNRQEVGDRSAAYAGVAFQRIGPSGAEPLGSHLRAYDGVPARHAEHARRAYGDAICPSIATAIGRAIMTVEQKLI